MSTARVAADVVELADWVHLEPGDVLFAEGDAVRRRLPRRQRSPRRRRSDGAPRRRGRPRRDRRRDRPDRADPAIGDRRRPARDARWPASSVDAFRSLAAAHPALMLQLSRTILARLGRPADRHRPGPVDRRRRHRAGRHPAVRHRAWPTSSPGTARPRHLWAARDRRRARAARARRVRARRHPAGAVRVPPGRRDRHTTTSCWRPTATTTRWTRRALALADRIVVVMSAQPGRGRAAPGGGVLAAGPARSRVERWLALRPPAGHRAADGAGGRRRPPRRRPGRPRARGLGRRPRPARPARVRATPPGSCSAAAAPAASPTSACGGPCASSASTSTPSAGRRSARRSAPAMALQIARRRARPDGRRAVPRPARLHGAGRLARQGRAHHPQHHQAVRRRRRARPVAAVLLRVDEPHPLAGRGPRPRSTRPRRSGPAWRSPASCRRCRSAATCSSTAGCSTTCRAT